VSFVVAVPDGIVLPQRGGDWAAVLYMALGAGALALVAQTWAQAHLPAARAAIVMTMEPVFAASFAVALGGEAVTLRLLGGGALVLAAMYLVELAPRRRIEAEVMHLGQ
jgi:drug/metabolite transporter (DMT)-like permease